LGPGDLLLVVGLAWGLLWWLPRSCRVSYCRAAVGQAGAPAAL